MKDSAYQTMDRRVLNVSLLSLFEVLSWIGVNGEEGSPLFLKC